MDNPQRFDSRSESAGGNLERTHEFCSWDHLKYSECVSLTPRCMKSMIRPYQPEDRDEVRRICYETSFQGRPDLFKINRDFVADVLTSYYLDYEPDLCFVAVDDQQRVAGYIFGARNKRAMLPIWRWKMLPFFMKCLFQRGVFLSAEFWRLMIRAAWSVLRGECLVPDCSRDYPALLHINLRPDSRGSGIGRLLIETFLRQLSSANVIGVHLSTSSDEAKKFFESNGFRVFHTTRRTYYRYKLGHDITHYLMVKKIP